MSAAGEIPVGNHNPAVEELHAFRGSSSWTRFPSGSFKVAIRTLA